MRFSPEISSPCAWLAAGWLPPESHCAWSRLSPGDWTSAAAIALLPAAPSSTPRAHARAPPDSEPVPAVRNTQRCRSISVFSDTFRPFKNTNTCILYILTYCTCCQASHIHILHALPTMTTQSPPTPDMCSLYCCCGAPADRVVATLIAKKVRIAFFSTAHPPLRQSRVQYSQPVVCSCSH